MAACMRCTEVRRLRQAQSTYEAVTDIIKREGIRGLYSGVGSSLLGIAVTNGCVVVRMSVRLLCADSGERRA